jgi:hypothetical protein
MANQSSPMGFRPVGTIGQSSYNGKIETFYCGDATAIGIGDPVTIVGAGGIHTDGKTPIITRATSTAVVCGVLTGIMPVPTDLTLTGHKASQATFCLVDTDPNTIYEIQEDSVGGSIALADGTKNANFVLGTVDTTTWNGKTMLDSSSAAASATLDCLLLRPSPVLGNTAAATYAKWLVAVPEVV